MKKIVLVDIDNTISKVGDRIRHLRETPPNYKEFHNRCDEDKPIEYTISVLNELMPSYEIIFVTMRPESVRTITEQWICSQLAWSFDILMRKDNDKRSDATIKIELIKQHGIKINDILFAIEDNDDIIKAYQRIGIDCIKVVGEYKPKRINRHKTLDK